MSITQRTSSKAPAAETLPRLTDNEVIALAEHHLAELADSQRTPPASVHVTSVPRLRKAGRRLLRAGAHLREIAGAVWRFVKSPRHLSGRWWTRVLLLAPRQTFNLWKALLLAFSILLGFSAYVQVRSVVPVRIGLAPFSQPFEQGGLWGTIGGTLFTGAVVGLLAALWNDLFRLPHLARRIRRQVRKRPDCVLLSDIGPRAVRLVPYQEPIEIAPRTEVYDQITPGVLSRKQKDVQIIVGDPGSGKTTALIGIAGLLAQIGIVPVLVPLRSLDDVDLVKLGEARFKEQIHAYARSDAEADQLWRWLRARRRVAILTDDLDRLSPDGERGFVLRKAIEDGIEADLPIVVTARPAGVPGGIAASAIDLGELDPRDAVTCVAHGARNDPGFRASEEVPRQALERWVDAGRLAEVPFYLELLAQLAAVGGRFPMLPEPGVELGGERSGLYRPKPDRTIEWNRWWVYFLLLEHYYEGVVAGRVRRWTGIETRERRSTLRLLQDAALGMLAAAALDAQASLRPREKRAEARPERSAIEDFIANDDRGRLGRAEPRRSGPRWPSSLRQAAIEDDEAEQDERRRTRVSAQEVIETGERLRILDRDAEDAPQFRHRIMQAYLAGRRLSVLEFERMDPPGGPVRSGGRDDWIELLLDRRHPEKLTAQTCLTFAALCADTERRVAEDLVRRSEPASAEAQRLSAESERWARVTRRIAWHLLDSAHASLGNGATSESAAREATPATVAAVAREDETGRSSLLSLTLLGQSDGDRASRGPGDIDPMHVRDPEDRRDPDDALIKLTTAADIARATECERGSPDRSALAWPRRREQADPDAGITQCDILAAVRESHLVTRWTKLNAIRSIAALDVDDRWKRIWAFARDPDYEVRQTAGDMLDGDAFEAYRALEDDVWRLLMRAAARSALGLTLQQHGREHADPYRHYDIAVWTSDDIEGLKALGSVLPAIVSGLREDPSTHAPEAWAGGDGAGPRGPERRSVGSVGRNGSGDFTPQVFALYGRRARTALEQLVALAFQGEQLDLEQAVAKGFRSDAMRHVADAPAAGREPNAAAGSHVGPGWVASHARLVSSVCLARAESWYAQLVLGQALALYTVAGAQRQVAYDTFARCLHRGAAARHPFTQRAVRKARAAVRRSEFGSDRWQASVWSDEVHDAHRRHVALTNATAQLLADVTVLLDLDAGAQEDRREPFGHMRELPYCLHESRDRREILGTGCPPECGWNLCPYKQPPPDEPNEHRGVSRAFCRQQREIAWHRRPRWQRRIRRRRLAEFWHKMEMRART